MKSILKNPNPLILTFPNSLSLRAFTVVESGQKILLELGQNLIGKWVEPDRLCISANGSIFVTDFFKPVTTEVSNFLLLEFYSPLATSEEVSSHYAGAVCVEASLSLLLPKTLTSPQWARARRRQTVEALSYRGHNGMKFFLKWKYNFLHLRFHFVFRFWMFYKCIL